MHSEQREADKLISKLVKLLQQDFIVVGKERVSPVVSWTVLAFFFGMAITFLFVVSQRGEVQIVESKIEPKMMEGDHKEAFHISCNDVRRGQDVSVQPFTGQVSNQFQRRAMAEKRLFVCMWRSYRYVQALQKDNPELKGEIDRLLNQAENWAGRAIRRYQSLTVRTMASPQNVQYAIGKGGYVWIYPPHGMGALREALRLAPTWVAAHPDTEVMSFLDATIDGSGKIVPANSKPTKRAPTIGKKDEIMMFGVIRTNMKFDPLTPEMISLLDETQELHEKWKTAVIAREDSDMLQTLVMDHHESHHMLEMMSRSADERALLSINIHTPHEICWDRPHAEIDNMVSELNDIHAQWVNSVKNRDFLGAWTNGLRHSRLHAMSSTCGLKLPEVPDPGKVPLTGDDEELTPEELQLIGGPVEEEIIKAGKTLIE